MYIQTRKWTTNHYGRARVACHLHVRTCRDMNYQINLTSCRTTMQRAHVPCPSCEAVTSCRVVKWYFYLLYLRIKRIASRQRDGSSYLLPRARLHFVPVVQHAGDLLPTSHVRDRKPSDSTLSWSDETINLSHHKCSVNVQRHFIKVWHKLVSVTRPRTLGSEMRHQGLWPSIWNDKLVVSDGKD